MLIMSDDNLLASSEYLIKRFDADMKDIHSKMQLLEIAYTNLKGTWFSIGQVHQLFKMETEENH